MGVKMFLGEWKGKSGYKLLPRLSVLEKDYFIVEMIAGNKKRMEIKLPAAFYCPKENAFNLPEEIYKELCKKLYGGMPS